MTAINVKGFRGKVPRISPRLLQPNFATEALNCKITSGRLDPLKGPTLVHTSLANAIQTLFRYRNLATDYWLVWGRTVDAVRSPTAQDARNRIFYTGDGEPRMTSFADAITGPGPYPAGWYVLGVYIPTTAPTVAAVAGSGAVESRAYVYTFVTQYGEESAQSPATVVNGFANSTSWSVTALEANPPNSGTVTAASTVSPGVVEVTLDTTRGLQPYEEITFSGVVGMTSLNATFAISAIVAGNKVQVPLSTAQTYTSGGAWSRRAPHNVTGMKKRIYRTVAGSAEYQYVGETTGTTYSDTIAGSALGELLPTLDSYTPPKNMHSLVALANGALAGIAGNEICISEQYKPYSWPLANRYAFAGTGVAACAAGNSVIVLTDTYPVVAVATVPDAASVGRLPIYAPCVAKRGMVDIGGGCIYPSHDGLYLLTPSDGKNLTDELFRHDEWQLLQPSTFKAAFFDQGYYAMHDAPAGQTPKVLVLDVKEPDSVTEVDTTFDALYSNPLDGKLYTAKANLVYKWDEDDANRYLSYWQSPEFQSAPPINFACAQVHAKFSDIVPPDTSTTDANAALLASAENIEGSFGGTVTGMYPLGASNLKEQALATANRVQFALVAGGEIVFSKGLTSSDPFRLPGLVRAESHQIQISSSVPVFSVTVAQSMEELSETSA